MFRTLLLFAGAVAPPLSAQQITLVVGNGLSPAPIQVDVNSSGFPRTVAFGATTSYAVPFPSAGVRVDVAAGASALSTTFFPGVETDYSIVVHPDAAGVARIGIYDEDESPIPLGGGGRLVFRHLAALGSVDATVRDANGQLVTMLLQNVNAAELGVDLPSGAYSLEFRSTGSATLLLPAQAVTVGLGEHDVVALVGAPPTGLATLTAAFARPQTVVLAGPGCSGALVRYYATVDAGGADLEFATGPVPAGALVYLLFGVQPATIALAPYGAPGCEVLANVSTIVPLANLGGFASFQFLVPASIASTIGPTWWQFGHTGAGNVLGVETTTRARLVLN